MRHLVFVFSLLGIFALGACGEYQKVVESTDTTYQLEKAIEYYEAEEYDKAQPLFDKLLKVYRGTQKAATVYYYYAETNFAMESYILAAYHYSNFAKTFPEHEKTPEAYYKVGLSYYRQSPRPSLDQAYTHKAIDALQLYANLYPGEGRLQEVNELIEDLRAKLERKVYERAKLYFNMENFQAAVSAFNNVMDQFPDTQYRENAMYFRTLSAYKLAEGSIPSKQRQRFIEARTSLREFKSIFQQSEYLKELNPLEDKIKAFLTHNPTAQNS